MPKQLRQMIMSRIRDYGSNHALRVLALASKSMEQASSRLHLEDESGLTFLGLTGMQVPLLIGSDTFMFCS